MSKNLLLAISLFSSSAFSQVSYQSSNYAVANDTFRISKSIDLKDYIFETTGTGITWDYSTLKPYTQVMEKMVTPGSTGYVFTPLAFQQSLDIADPVSDTIHIGSVQLYNVYSFFDKTNALYQQQGTAAEINGVAIKSKFTSPDVLYKFPMAYGNPKDSSSSSYEMSVPNFLYFHHSQKRVNQIEGWGALKTPYGSFDAIKLKSVRTCTDTMNIKGTGIPSYTYTIIEYKWFTPGKKAPLLTVSQQIVGGYTVAMKAEYLDNPRYFEPTAFFAFAPAMPFIKENVQFQNLSANATSYSWNFGDPNSGSANTSTTVNPEHTYNATGQYTVRLIASNPTFKDTFMLKIAVVDSEEVVAAFTYDPMNPCVGDSIWITDQSRNAINYNIDFGDGTSPTTFSMTSGTVEFQYVYEKEGDYPITWIVDDGTKSDTIIKLLHVTGSPVVNFTNTTAQVNKPVTFTNSSTKTNENTKYHWDFGFGATPRYSTEKNPVVTYATAGNKTIVLAVTNGGRCSESIVRSITVAAGEPQAVVANFSYSPTNLCKGDTLLFTNLSMNAQNYWIDFGDNTSPTTFSITSGDIEFEYFYEKAGDYQVKWVVDNGVKGDTLVRTIHISDSPSASFNVGNVVVNKPVLFTNTSTNTDISTSYHWDFGDDASPSTSTEKSPTVIFTSGGNKTVLLMVQNGKNCMDDVSQTIPVSVVTSALWNVTNEKDIIVSPNPFVNETTISFTLTAQENVKITVYNMLGERVDDLLVGSLGKGSHTVYFKNNAPGMYLLKMNIGNTSSIKRVLSVK